MLRVKLWGPAILVAAALGGFPPAALAEANGTSDGCNGNIVALMNHVSGLGGASGNPNASAGPGFFLAGANPGSVSDAIHAVRYVFCS
jgi:hypothetical protein